MTNGPAKPARLPMELTSAMPPAAAAPEKKAVGSVQKTGKQANTPKPGPTTRAFQRGIFERRRDGYPADAINREATWPRRSCCRSDAAVQTMVTAPTT